jgi:hypothetical protein
MLAVRPDWPPWEDRPMPKPDANERRKNKVVRNLLEATDRTLASLEELKEARAALSLESSRPPLKIADEEDARDEN